MKPNGALLSEFNKPWAVEEIEIGAPAHDEVQVQLEVAGMCNSGHHLVTGAMPTAGLD